MNIEPIDWSVVVSGYWNPAILTPAGIATRLFSLPQGTPVEVEVPLDGLAPYRVKQDQVIVMVQPHFLHILTQQQEYKSLEQALKVASTALNQLPETPVKAAGFNLRFRLHNPPNSVFENVAAKIDDLLSDAEYKILTRVLRRSLNWKNGALNVEISWNDEGIVMVAFNFDRQSTSKDDLLEWLAVPTDTIKEAVESFFKNMLQIALPEIGDEEDDSD